MLFSVLLDGVWLSGNKKITYLLTYLLSYWPSPMRYSVAITLITSSSWKYWTQETVYSMARSLKSKIFFVVKPHRSIVKLLVQFCFKSLDIKWHYNLVWYRIPRLQLLQQSFSFKPQALTNEHLGLASMSVVQRPLNEWMNEWMNE